MVADSQLGTDDMKFIDILSRRSFAHLRLVFQHYAKVGLVGTAILSTQHTTPHRTVKLCSPIPAFFSPVGMESFYRVSIDSTV